MSLWTMALDVCRWLALFVSICSIDASCIISTCYRCELPSSDDTANGLTVDQCLTSLSSSSSYQTATFDGVNMRCRRHSTNQRLDYSSNVNMVTFRKTCNTDCPVYSWTRDRDREFEITPVNNSYVSESACLAICADTIDCRMLEYKDNDNWCGWRTDCNTSCSLKDDNSYDVYTRWCYTGVDCGLATTAVANGYANYVDDRPTHEGSNISYNCDMCYEKANDNMRTCQSDGTWSTEVFTCNPKDCGNLSATTNGAWAYTTTTYGSTATLTCDPYYEVRSGWSSSTFGSSVTATCNCLASWWYTNYDCTKIRCPSTSLNNGNEVYSSSIREWGTTVNYNCDTGYAITSGDDTRTCLNTGVWNGTLPICSIINCGPPPAPVNGAVSTPDGTSYGRDADYSCNTGYTRIGDSQHQCNSSGLWSGTTPTCQIVDCGGVTAPSNGNVNVSLTTYYEYATFSCDLGYFLNGTSSIRCESSGSWSASGPTCDLVDCGTLSIANGSVTYQPLTTLDSEAKHICYPGYEITGGDETRICQASGSWNGSEAVCTIIDCGPVTVPINGSVSVSSTTYGSNASYNCDTGFDIQGLSVRTCNSSRLWSDIAPTCQLTDCGSLSAPANGNVTIGLTTYLEQATFICDHGYDMNGTDILICTASGVWDSAVPTCELVNCGVPSNITNGYVTYTLVTYGGQATYICNPGYEITGGDETQICQASGSWNGSEAVCTIIDCGPVTVPINGSVSVSSTTYGSNASYNCDTGFDIQGLSVRTCNSSRLWSDIAPTCQLTDCGSLSAPANGNVTVGLTTYLEQATFICDHGYDMNGTDILICTASGVWDSAVPTCELVNCGVPSNITNGYVTYTLVTYGGQATYICNPGYEITIGDETRTCQASGSWNGAQAVCTILDCGPVAAPVNGSVSASPTTHGSNATYTCDTGFDIQGVSVRTCNGSGLWSDTAATCQLTDCGSLTAPANGNVTVGLTTYLEQATFVCDHGYDMNGTGYLNCTASGAWDSAVPTCELVKCGGMSNITNGYVTHPLTTYGSPATYTCYTGYEISGGDETRTCEASGFWNGTEPTCTAVICESLLGPANGSVTHNSTTYASMAVYACEPGFNLNGTPSRTCQADKQWSSTAPVCDLFDCGLLPNPVNGTVSINTTLFLGVAMYTCDPGNLHVGVETRMCASPGIWTDVAPTCVYVDCGPFMSPVNGYVVASNTFIGATANFSCDAGYKLNGTSWTVCNESGFWDPPSVPICDAQYCPSPTNQTNGWVATENGTMIGKLAVYECFDGYIMNGSSTRECQTNLSWSGTEPTCDPVDCGPLAAPDDGSVSTLGGTVYPEVAQYSCNTGYIRSGPSARGCQTDGTWNETTPNCTIADCGSLSPPVHGHVSMGGGTAYSKTAIYTCDAGFVPAGLAARVCQANGAWSGVPATCVEEASVPPKIYIAPCVCVKNKTFTNLTQDEILTLLVKETAINLKNTTSALAKLVCRDDPRASSTSLGMLGVGMICLVMAFVFSMDFIRVCRWFSMMNRDRRYRAENEEPPPE